MPLLLPPNRSFACIVGLALLALLASTLSGTPEPNAVDAPIRIDEGSDFHMTEPALATQCGDYTLVAWAAGASQTSDHVIMGRWIKGLQLHGQAFQISVATGADQRQPRINIEDDGDFIVAWQSGGTTPRWRRFDGTTLQADSELSGAIPTLNTVRLLDVAIGKVGEVNATWADGNDIVGRRYDASNPLVIDDFSISTQETVDEGEADYFVDGFIVSWRGLYQVNGFDATRIRTQRFSASGDAQGSQFVVASAASDPNRTYYFGNPQLATNRVGEFVVHFDVVFQDSQYNDRYHPFLRYGTNDVRIDQESVGLGQGRAVAMDEDDHYPIVWTRLPFSSLQTQYDYEQEDLELDDGPFPPDVSAASEFSCDRSRRAVAWTSAGCTNGPAQCLRYQVTPRSRAFIMSDDFESGDLSRWCAVD